MQVQFDKITVWHSWKEQLSCSFPVVEGPIKNSEPVFIQMLVVANATNKKINEQDTKTFTKCFVGRNGKRNQQKLYTYTCVDRSRHNGIKGAMTKLAC